MLFPKITNKISEVQWHITHDFPSNIAEVEYIGTVKLHGVHADIVLENLHSSKEPRVGLQSRNRTDLTPEDDHENFAAFCAERKAAITKIRDALLLNERYRQYTGRATAEEEPIILAGEWIGTGIQKRVAIVELSRRFAITSIHIAGTWLPIEEFPDICAEEDGIFNICKAGFWRRSVSLADPELFMAEARKLTAQVGASCPFAKVFGVDGAGEGIVWTPAYKSSVPNLPQLWLKTKGDEFAKPVVKCVEQVAQKQDQRGKAAAFAQRVCTEARLEQAWQYMKEMGIERTNKGIGAFLKWVQDDIAVEEKGEIRESALGSAWKAEVVKIARPWFETQLYAGPGGSNV